MTAAEAHRASAAVVNIMVDPRCLCFLNSQRGKWGGTLRTGGDVMSTSRRKAGATLQPWLTARADCREKRFIQVGNSLLLSHRFWRLSAGARYCYLCMAMEAGPRREFRLPKSAAEKYGIPHSSLCRYIHELEAGGWIEVRSMKLLRKPNEYRFALKWKGLSPSS